MHLSSPSMIEALPGVLGNRGTWLICTGKQCQNILGEKKQLKIILGIKKLGTSLKIILGNMGKQANISREQGLPWENFMIVNLFIIQNKLLRASIKD